MLNRTTADLASATVRTRYFQGRAAEEVAEDMPILPVDAPALPPPGPSFVRTAKLLGDPQPKQEFTKGGKPKKITGYRPHGPYLTALVRACLYQTGTVIPVGPDDAHSESFAFLPGLMMTGGADGTDLYGPGPCRLMVVGRYPGLSEVEQGRHFVGKGNEYLWQAWREAGIAKPSKDFPVFCTNLARFTPPLSMKDRLPKEVVQDGRHLLYQEIAVCRPEVILVLGAEALKALYGTSAKISDYAGRTATLQVDCRPDENTPSDLHAATVIVADHPAKVLRDPDAYPQFLASIRRTAQALGFVDKAKDVKKDYQKVLTLSELKAAVLESEKASAHGGYVSFDCEWEGKHPSDPDYYLYTVQWSHAPGHARVVFLRHCGGAPNASLPIDLARPWLRRLFEKAPDRGARLVAHFGKADLPGLYSIGVNLYDKFVGPNHDDPTATDALEAGDKTYYEGGFDTYVAGHAVDESAALKLELLVANRLGIDRYDTDVIAWRESYCREKKIKRSQLKGYGNCPENLIFHYGGADADYTGRLYLHYNGDPRTGTRGVLDCDQFGNSSRKIFGLRMRAWGAWAEMERYGLEVDRYQHRILREQIVARREELLAEFRQKAQWEAGPNDAEGFSPTKTRHKVEFLFGEQYSKDGKPIRPPGALSLYLKPYKSTKASGGRLWDEALWRAHKGGLPDPVPAADKETTVILSRQHPLVALLKDIDLLTTAMKIMFRLPVETDEEEEEFDAGLVEYEQDPEDEVHDRGFVSLIDHDGRIRSVFGIVETGRASSSRPNLQNCFLPGVTEYLTDRGWVLVDQLAENDKVAQFDPVTQEVSFTTPLARIEKAWDGDVVRLETDEQICVTTTPDHRCLTRERKRDKAWAVTPPEGVRPDRLYYHAGNYAGGPIRLSPDQVVLLCATQADGSFEKRSNAIYFGFAKKRKADRLAAALANLGVTWTTPKGGNPYTFYLTDKQPNGMRQWVRDLLGPRKQFGRWLLEFDRTTLELIAEEMFHWDGLHTRRSETFSSDKTSADWMQIVYTLTGVRARMRSYHNGNPNARVCHIVGVPRRRVPYSMTTNRRTTRRHYRGNVYCVSVPTSYIVVRENGCVSIIGNCSESVDEQYDRILQQGPSAPATAPDNVKARRFHTKSVMRAQDGWFLITADLMGAEIAAAGWSCGDPLLVEHARRATLPADHPDVLDLHSDLAKSAFRLECSLKDVKKLHKSKRTGAKRARFGHYYGASPDSIYRKALEDDPNVTLEDIVALVKNHDQIYPVLANHFAVTRKRVTTHGWFKNGYGGNRRFRPATDRERVAGQEREAQNWLCQGLVADNITSALGNCWYEFRKRKMLSRIVLSIHDSIMVEAPAHEVAAVVDEVLPLCMSHGNPVPISDLDGNPVNRGPYYFGIDTAVYRSWGVEVEESDWRKACEEANAKIRNGR